MQESYNANPSRIHSFDGFYLYFYISQE
jgi:hypothetical protein